MRILVMLALLLTFRPAFAQGASTLMPYPYAGQGTDSNYANYTESLIKNFVTSDESNGIISTYGSKITFGTINWTTGSRSSGHLVINTSDYPDGLSGLCSYIHGQGYLCWAYVCVGPGFGCGNGSSSTSTGHESTDCSDLVSYGVDQLYVDGPDASTSDFEALGDACHSADTNILIVQSPDTTGSGLSGSSGLCPTYYGQVIYTPGNDESGPGAFTFSAMASLVDGLNGTTTTGCWSQPTGLQLSNPSYSPGGGAMSLTEAQTAIDLWSIYAAPIAIGLDPTQSANASYIALFANSETAACDQDALGTQGARISGSTCAGGNNGVYAKPVSGSSYCVALVNCSGSTANVTLTFSNLQGSPASSYNVRDLHAHSNLGTYSTNYTASSLASHGDAMLKLSPVSSGGGDSAIGYGFAIGGGATVQ